MRSPVHGALHQGPANNQNDIQRRPFVGWMGYTSLYLQDDLRLRSKHNSTELLLFEPQGPQRARQSRSFAKVAVQRRATDSESSSCTRAIAVLGGDCPLNRLNSDRGRSRR